jgi:phospholipid/cholesterol/gamma-HCH transport system substrate-binding protein
MQVKSVEIMVGLFVAAGIAALFMLAMKVSNLSSFNEGGSYTLSAYFENIGGLKPRSPVRIGGVLIGRIAAIDYDNETYQAVVTLMIDKRYMRLPTDTSASIYTAGLLGEQYIGLEPGGEEEFLKDGDRIRDTQSALVLERMIGKFLFNSASDGGL